MNRYALMTSARYFAPADAPGGGAPAAEPSATPAPAPAAAAAAPSPEPAAAPSPAPTPEATPSPAPAAEPAAAVVDPAASAVDADKKPDAPALKAHSETKSALSSDAPAEVAKEAPKPGDPVVDPAAATVVDPAAAPEPVKYEFTLPEGVKADEKAMGDFKTVLAENKIPPELGQKFVDMHLGAMTQFANQALQQQHDAFGKMRSDWASEIKADEQMGGSGYETTKKNAAEMIERFVPKERRQAFDQMMDTTGVGDHPEFWRFLTNLSKRFKEPTPLPSDIGRPPKDIGGKPKGGRAGLYDHPSSAKMKA